MELELHNRFLKIGQEYGIPAGEALAGKHRSDDVINVVINDVIKFTESEEPALRNKAGLKRRGARKNGEWYFESGVSEQ